MIATKCSIEELNRALEIINTRHYNNNIQFIYLEQKKRGIGFRLKAIDSHGNGGRFGYHRNKNGERRRLGNAACWHVHGHFFAALFSINNAAKVVSVLGTITAKGGNWTNKQCGSMLDPIMYSELCGCKNAIN